MKKLLLLLLIAPVLGFGQGEQRYADGTATDQDGNTFEWINYGTQDWAIEDAKVVTYRDGTAIPKVEGQKGNYQSGYYEWTNSINGRWCYQMNDESKGKLYNWYAVMGIHDNDETTPNKEFAPYGWRVPTDADWTELENYLIANGYNYDGSLEENKIAKSMASTLKWTTNQNQGGIGNDLSQNNKSGFNVFPNGFRQTGGGLQLFREYVLYYFILDFY